MLRELTPWRWAQGVLAVGVASWRLTRWRGRGGVAEYLDSCRRRSLFSPRWRRPEVFGRLVWRLGGWLPPAGMGVCLRRSLLLFELWQRCGVEVVLHVGLELGAQGRRAHAWLSCNRPELGRFCGGPAGTVLAASYPPAEGWLSAGVARSDLPGSTASASTCCQWPARH